MTLKLVMMGTGDFAVPTFQALYGTSHTVEALYTQPDRIRTGQERHANPMKPVAAEHGTPIQQPERVNTPESLDELRNLAPDVLVVAAYGQILSRALLAIPRLRTINVHASLLPKYRGAAPINYAIWKGEAESGVSIIEIQPKLDAGPVLAAESTPIGSEETAGELESRLAAIGASLAIRVLDELERGTAVGIEQDAGLATFAPKLTKEQAAIDWTRSAAEVDCHIRAMQPWPTPFTFLHRAGKPPQRCIIRKVRPFAGLAKTGGQPGTVVVSDKEHLVVQTGSVPLWLVEIQPQGKRPMSGAEFARGARIAVGDQFGPDVDPS